LGVRLSDEDIADIEVLIRDFAMVTISFPFCIWNAHWRHLANTTEPSMCGGDAALCQITLTTCSIYLSLPSIRGRASGVHTRSRLFCVTYRFGSAVQCTGP